MSIDWACEGFWFVLYYVCRYIERARKILVLWNWQQGIEVGGGGVLAQYLEQTVELREVRYGYLYRYVCMFNVHIDRLPGPLATMISPPSFATPSPYSSATESPLTPVTLETQARPFDYFDIIIYIFKKYAVKEPKTMVLCLHYRNSEFTTLKLICII